MSRQLFERWRLERCIQLPWVGFAFRFDWHIILQIIQFHSNVISAELCHADDMSWVYIWNILKLLPIPTCIHRTSLTYHHIKNIQRFLIRFIPCLLTALTCDIPSMTHVTGLYPPCLPTCGDPTADLKCDIPPQLDVCTCPLGQVLFAGECIDKSSCQCIDDDGRQYQVNFRPTWTPLHEVIRNITFLIALYSIVLKICDINQHWLKQIRSLKNYFTQTSTRCHFCW